MPMLLAKRVYEPPKASDGFRVLVDRLWPRGLGKDKARLDLWAKEIAPSTKLRREFNHQPEKFAEFKRLYRFELAANPALDAFRDEVAGKRKVTLLFGARDPKINHAVVLAEYLKQAKPKKKARAKKPSR
jgi:uncharacterized protein YeaO (DUF488 family)